MLVAVRATFKEKKEESTQWVLRHAFKLIEYLHQIIRNPSLLVAQVLVLIRVHHQDGVPTIDCPFDVEKLGTFIESVVNDETAGPLPGTYYACARCREFSTKADFLSCDPLSELRSDVQICTYIQCHTNNVNVIHAVWFIRDTL